MPSGKRAGETRGPTKRDGQQKQSLTTEAASQGTSSFSLDGSSGKLPTPKKSKTIEKTGSTSISESILTHFSPIATRLRSTSDNMNETENSIDRDETGSLDGPSSQLNQSPIESSSSSIDEGRWGTTVKQIEMGLPYFLTVILSTRFIVWPEILTGVLLLRIY